MARESKKRSADEAVAHDDDDVSSPKRAAVDEEDDEAVKEEENEDSMTQDEDVGVKNEDNDDDDDGEEEQEEEHAVAEDAGIKEDEEEEKDPVGIKEDDDDEEEAVEENNDKNDQMDEDDNFEEGDVVDDDDDEEEEDLNGDNPLSRRQINVAGKPAEAGVIKTIYVENFMCHPKLTVDLCRNVNFINGQNGSGKSAILAAIQTCLGASAKRTNRGRNIKELVRKEAAGRNPNTSAKVRVTLLNGGGDAYKPDLYGDTITIERCISLRGGYNGYRLLDSNMKEVSKSKRDLEDLLDYMNIQVENPVAILSQEDAKTFLNGKAEDKYKFFMKATELQRIDRTFASIVDQVEDLENKKTTLTDALQAKMENVKALEKKVEEFQAVEKLQKRLLDNQVEFAWAFYAERNAEHEETVSRVEAFQAKVEAKEQELTQAEEEASGANDEDEENRIKTKMEDLKNEANAQTALKLELENELAEAQGPVKKIRRELKQIEGERKQAEKDLGRARKRLKDARDEIKAKAGSAESEAARRATLLDETEEALAQAKGETDTIKEAVALSLQAYEAAEPAADDAKHNASRKAADLKSAKARLQELRSSTGSDAASIFGPKCSKMKALVERNRRRFKGEVIGPIGAYLKIAPGKEKYAALAEMFIGNNTLDRFIVTCDADRKLCEQLRREAGCRKECGLFQVKVSRRFQVPAPPSDEIETVASVLVVSNDIVFNCLVDNARIDQRALAETKEVSERCLLVTDSNGRYSIKGNINEVAFLPRGDKWSTRDGSISLNSNDRQLRETRIGVDLSAAIEETQREVRGLDEELKELREVETAASRELLDLKRKWNDKQKAMRKNEDDINQLAQKKGDLVAEMETTADVSIDTTEFEEDCAQCEEAVENIKQRETQSRKEMEELLPGVADVKKRLEEVVARNDKVLEDMTSAQSDLEQCVARLTQSQADLEKKRQKVQKYKDTLKGYQPDVDKAAEECADALRKARTLTLRKEEKEQRDEADDKDVSQQSTQDFTDEALERVDVITVPKDSKTYQAKLKRLNDKISRERERRDLSNEDPAVAIEKHSRAKRDLQDTQVMIDHTNEVASSMQRDLKERRKRWKRLRKYLENMTDSRFDEILQLNQSSGQLEFDNDGQALNLIVQKSINDPDSQTKDVKSLSGGERSYTTISLLLALGESLETPFRVLDEFDVFLDTQARKLTIQTLIHVAKKMEHRQFIFITPQDLSSVTPDNKCKIFKLKNPDRREVAGGPMQQTLNFSQT